MQHVDVQYLDARPSERLQIQSSLGETLRHERQRRGVTLEELHEVTKIKLELLELLEQDRHQHLPAPIFVRGFIKAVCRYLELPADDLLSMYNREGPTTPVRVMTNTLLVPRPNIWVRMWRWVKAIFIGRRLEDS